MDACTLSPEACDKRGAGFRAACGAASDFGRAAIGRWYVRGHVPDRHRRASARAPCRSPLPSRRARRRRDLRPRRRPHDLAALAGDPAHWRGRIAATQYCTHTVSPVLAVSGAHPVEATAWPVRDEERPHAVVIVVRLSSGALAMTRHGFLQGDQGSHWSWMSVRGSRGLVESVRSGGDRAWSVRLRRDRWAAGERPAEEERTPAELILGGERVPRMDEGTARIVAAFRATIGRGDPPLVGVRARYRGIARRPGGRGVARAGLAARRRAGAAPASGLTAQPRGQVCTGSLLCMLSR